MSYLDVSPMIAALQRTPEAFQMYEGWLTHAGSWHSFRFGPGDQVEIRAACNCALLAIRPEQRPALSQSFRDWESTYWRPLRINREFASHFSPQPGLLGMLIAVTGRLHAWLLQAANARHGAALAAFGLGAEAGGATRAGTESSSTVTAK